MLDSNPDNKATLGNVSRIPYALAPGDLREGGPEMIPQGRYGKLPIRTKIPSVVILQIPTEDRDGMNVASNFIKFKWLGNGKGPCRVPNDARDKCVSRKTRVIHYSRIISICKRSKGRPIIIPQRGGLTITNGYFDVWVNKSPEI